jgi:hypothetical protein
VCHHHHHHQLLLLLLLERENFAFALQGGSWEFGLSITRLGDLHLAVFCTGVTRPLKPAFASKRLSSRAEKKKKNDTTTEKKKKTQTTTKFEGLDRKWILYALQK